MLRPDGAAHHKVTPVKTSTNCFAFVQDRPWRPLDQPTDTDGLRFQQRLRCCDYVPVAHQRDTKENTDRRKSLATSHRNDLLSYKGYGWLSGFFVVTPYSDKITAKRNRRSRKSSQITASQIRRGSFPSRFTDFVYHKV